MQVRHLGHASLLVTTDTTRMLVDPGVWSDQWHDEKDLELVAITHQHADHLDREHLPSLLAANPGARVMAEAQAAALLDEDGIAATVLDPGDELRVGDLGITAVGGDHARIHPDVPLVGNVGLVLEHDDGARLFHPGDCYDVVPDSIDVLALPLSAPWTSLAKTVDFARAVDAPSVVPIHDALLSEPGRATWLRLLVELTDDDITLADLSDGSRLTL